MDLVLPAKVHPIPYSKVEKYENKQLVPYRCNESPLKIDNKQGQGSLLRLNNKAS